MMIVNEPMLMTRPVRRWLPTFDITGWSAAVLVAGLLVDVVFIQLDRMYLQGKLSMAFSLDSERGYAELYQNSKEFALVVVAFACWIRSRQALYGCWFGIFTYVFLDDTFQIHETLGALVSHRFAFAGPLGLRSADIGELLVSALVGIMVCMSLVIAWRRSGDAARRVSVALIALLIALAFFGIVMDMLHAIMTGPADYRLGIVEDGGEMIVVTTLLWFLYTRWRATSGVSAVVSSASSASR